MSRPSKFSTLHDNEPLRVETPDLPAAPPAAVVQKPGPGRPPKKNPKYKDSNYKSSTHILEIKAYAAANYRMAIEGIHGDMSTLLTWLLQEYAKAPVGSVPQWSKPHK